MNFSYLSAMLVYVSPSLYQMSFRVMSAISFAYTRPSDQITRYPHYHISTVSRLGQLLSTGGFALPALIGKSAPLSLERMPMQEDWLVASVCQYRSQSSNSPVVGYRYLYLSVNLMLNSQYAIIFNKLIAIFVINLYFAIHHSTFIAGLPSYILLVRPIAISFVWSPNY